MDDLIRKYTTPLDTGVTDGLRRLGLDSYADRVVDERLPSYRAETATRRQYLNTIEELTVRVRRTEASLHRKDLLIQSYVRRIRELEEALNVRGGS